MGLLADRAIGHGAGREASEDRLDGLDLLERDGYGRRPPADQPAQGGEVPALLVDELRVLLVDPVLAGARRVLELEDGVRVEEVVLAVAPPLVLAAPVQIRVAHGSHGEGALVPAADLLGEDVEADARDARSRAGEVAVDQVAVQSDGLEDLSAAVALERRDPHLGHDLEDPLVERLDVVLDRLRVVDPAQEALADHVVQGLEGHPRVDGAGAVPDEQAHVVDLARVAGLEDEPTARALTPPHEVVMDRGGGDEARDRRALAAHAAVGQDDDVVAVGDRLARQPLELLERPLEPRRPVGQGPQHGQRDGLEAGGVDMRELGEFRVGDHGVPQHDLAARRGLGLEQITLGPDRGLHRGHQLLADLVERRVRHLREELLEVVVERPRPV